MLTLSFKRKKIPADREKSFHAQETDDNALEEKYRAGFSLESNNDEQNEETYPLERFRRDVILCLLIQGNFFFIIY